MSTLSLSVTAQDKSSIQNVRFGYYSHNKVWDSKSTTVQKVKNLVVEAFKYIANAFLMAANTIHSMIVNKRVVVAEKPVISTPKPVDHIVEKEKAPEKKPEELSVESTIETTPADEDEGIPADENDSWLSVSSIVKMVGSAALIGGAVYLAYHFGPSLSKDASVYCNGTFAKGVCNGNLVHKALDHATKLSCNGTMLNVNNVLSCNGTLTAVVNATVKA
jgi:hypothetical protein